MASLNAVKCLSENVQLLVYPADVCVSRTKEPLCSPLFWNLHGHAVCQVNYDRLDEEAGGGRGACMETGS